ncbi:MAG: aspartyl-tRNA(Asn)/glutamyl-tRNA(Gln) amidotransferase subunit A [Parasphingorhabdus sp.]|jgi:aspartyl-tRNA(Asn)/glutamyl-tRNA(Gln) amidotransferase subunit A
MLHHHSVAELSRLLADKKCSSVELCQFFLDRIETHSELNAFITLDSENALNSAAKADQERADTVNNGLLHGIPMAHKDIFCTKGVKTSCGSKILDNFISPYNATVVDKLRQSGMVMLGKTNMDEFAMGSSNETSWYGNVHNPWDTTCVPGGSSGGSASAVAARLVPIATGTDTGGSIRQPAAFCGLTGLKPSYGTVSRYGMIAFASSLDQAGPIAQTAEDAAIMFDAMKGFDERDSTSLQQAQPSVSTGLNQSLQGLKIGLPKVFFDSGVDSSVASAIESSIEQLQALGATTVEVDLPNSPAGIPCYYVIAPAEASSNLSRFDGVRYGHRSENANDLTELYELSRSEGFGDEVKRRIMIGTYALSSGYYDAYYIKAQRIRRLISNDFDRAFEKCDVILGPTTPTTAFKIGEKTDDPVSMYLNDIFTNTVNLAGLPGLSLPVGFDTAGLPIGMQLIGRYLDEGRLLNIGHQYQQVSDWHRKLPEGYSA